MFSFMGQLCNSTPYSNAIKIWKAIRDRKQREWSPGKGLIHHEWVLRSLRQWAPASVTPSPAPLLFLIEVGKTMDFLSCRTRLEGIVNSLSQETEKVWVQRRSPEQEGEWDFYADHLSGGWEWQSWNGYVESKPNTKHRYKSSSVFCSQSGFCSQWLSVTLTPWPLRRDLGFSSSRIFSHYLSSSDVHKSTLRRKECSLIAFNPYK